MQPLTLSPKLEGTWFYPSGKIKPGETVAECVQCILKPLGMTLGDKQGWPNKVIDTIPAARPLTHLVDTYPGALKEGQCDMTTVFAYCPTVKDEKPVEKPDEQPDEQPEEEEEPTAKKRKASTKKRKTAKGSISASGVSSWTLPWKTHMHFVRFTCWSSGTRVSPAGLRA